MLESSSPLPGTIPGDGENALHITDLVKRYDTGTEALRGVSLEIASGEFFGLLGPNGAGKSTLIHCSTGLSSPTSGEIRVFGHDAVDDYVEAREAVGLAPQDINLDWFLTVEETLDFHGGYFGMSKKDRKERVGELLQAFSLTEKRHERTRTLSGGMKRRVVLARALTHRPRLLILDEPTAGVDVELRHDMWKMVKEMRDRGVTIILTTHYIEEAELMADRIGVINKGELIVVEDKTTLMQRLGKRQLEIVLREPIEKVPDELKDVTASKDNTVLTYTFDVQNSDGIAPLLAQLSKLGLEIKDLRSKESSLEDIFVTLVHGARS